MNKGGYRNYDSSSFSSQSVLQVVEGDEKANDKALNDIWQNEYSLAEFIKEEQFDDYDDLKKRLQIVLGEQVATSNSPAPERTEAAPSVKSQSSDEDEDDDMDYFNKLVNSDD